MQVFGFGSLQLSQKIKAKKQKKFLETLGSGDCQVELCIRCIVGPDHSFWQENGENMLKPEVANQSIQSIPLFWWEKQRPFMIDATAQR